MPKIKSKLETIIESMLKENTGVAMLDSGGAYGRNWERNQKRDFTKEPACEVECNEFKDGDVELIISYNIYHYLVNFLEYDEDCEKLNEDFKKFCETPEFEKENWLTCMESWCSEREFFHVYTTNTYNYENILSQTIQYTTFSLTDDEYDVHILLQIHGGCDVRGGYTKPVIFKVPERDYFMMAQNDVYAFARNQINKNQKIMNGVEPPREFYQWDSDDGGYHWYAQDGEPKLKDILRCKNDKPFVEIDGKLLPLEISVMESY